MHFLSAEFRSFLAQNVCFLSTQFLFSVPSTEFWSGVGAYYSCQQQAIRQIFLFFFPQE